MTCRDHRRTVLGRRIALAALAPVASLCLSGAARAAVLAEPEFGAQIGVASENIGKGLGKSGGDMSVSASVEASANGFYVAFEGSTVDLGGGADSELVTSLGYAPEVGGFAFDFSAMQKVHTGTVAGYDSRFMEYQADVSRAVGAVGLRLRVNYSPDSSGATEEAWWVEAQGGVALDSRTRATAALGERITDTGTEYTAWNVGVKRKLTRGLAVDVRWYDTDQHVLGERYEGRLVGALTYTL